MLFSAKRNSSIKAILIICIATLSMAAAAQSSPPASPAAPIEEILIVGEQPGPGMWKVTKGNNTLWVIGIYTPLPQKMKWRAKGIREVVASAQEVLAQPGTVVSTKQIGIFRAITLIPSAMEARKSPDGARLKELVPDETYQRWLALRDKYIDANNTDDESQDIERWRPMFAALELYSKAITKSGMTQKSPVWDEVSRIAKLNKVKITKVSVEPQINDPRGAIRDLNKTRLNDIDCFTKTIDRIESELVVMRKRANAWASGDVEILRSTPWRDQREACSAAIREATFVQKLGVQDIATQVENAWLAQAEKSLATNATTVAVLSMDQALSKTNYLAKLKAKGYVVVEPDAAE
jgi:TraB/PrgY/gumN family